MGVGRRHETETLQRTGRGMRILFVTENYPPETNASATRVSERARYWLEWKNRMTVITQAPNFPEGRVFDGYTNAWKQRENICGVDVIRVKTYMSSNAGFAKRILDFVSLMVNAFWAGLAEERPDVVVATSPQFFAAVGGWAIAKIRRVPFVFELSDLWPASIRAVGAMETSRALDLVEKLELFLYRQSAAVVALAPSFKEDLISRGIDPNKIDVVINGVDQSYYKPQPKDEELLDKWDLRDKFVVGYIGTHGMAHALLNVVDTAERLRDHKEIRFLMVGAGATRAAVEQAAAERGLDNIVFVPRQPKDRMPGFWSLCDAALIHLKDDPVFAGVIPSKIFEAMAMKLPLIYVGPQGDGSGIVERESAGVWVPPENPAAFAETVISLADDRGRLAQMAEKSFQAASRYSREKQARDMMATLERVVKNTC